MCKSEPVLTKAKIMNYYNTNNTHRNTVETMSEFTCLIALGHYNKGFLLAKI